ncbi:hypothetical protein EDB80DRAFT_77754 [Ilyonectria destructans]|nr:hypothetical protein EDB80DRAFT_77754 [Ilyonectria destructans]
MTKVPFEVWQWFFSLLLLQPWRCCCKSGETGVGERRARVSMIGPRTDSAMLNYSSSNTSKTLLLSHLRSSTINYLRAKSGHILHSRSSFPRTPSLIHHAIPLRTARPYLTSLRLNPFKVHLNAVIPFPDLGLLQT